MHKLASLEVAALDPYKLLAYIPGAGRKPVAGI